MGERRNTIKILFVGEGCYEMYEKAFVLAANGLEDVRADSLYYVDEWKEYRRQLMYRIELHYCRGYHTSTYNKKLINLAETNQYDMIFLYSCRHVYPETVKKLSQIGSYIASYCNDNPFSAYYPDYFWRHYKRSIPYCDMNYVYRESNLADVERAGSKRSGILRSYYIKSRNYNISGMPDDTDFPEVVFIGHYENDERKEFIESLLNSNIRVGLSADSWKEHIANARAVFLENTLESYNLVLNKAQIAIVFLSSINHDTYTRRCFEIPATKTMMLAPYTEDLASMFEEDKEAVYYRNKQDFVEKTKYYLAHPEERDAIGEAGYQRLMRDGHEAGDRVRQIIDDYNKYMGEKKEI